MKSKKIFFIVGLGLLLLSVIVFLSLKEDLVNPNCVPLEFTKFSDVLSFPRSPAICALNTTGQDYVVHNPIYYKFFWLGVILLIISLIIHLIKTKK